MGWIIFFLELKKKHTEMTPHKIIKSNRKTLSISVNDNAELIVRAPKRISNKQIKEFITEKANWINNKQTLMRARLNDVKKEQNMHLYLGDLFPIKITKIKDKEIIFNGKEFITNLQNKDALNLSLKFWYKKKFKEVAIPRLFYFANKHNLKINQVRIKEQKTLWGSCSSKNNINLNYLLIMAPLKVIDYVIIHELVHTIHKNHSENFWKSVASIMPNYDDAKHWLKENGYKLRNY